MSSAAAGWLMTSLDPHPLPVSLVQVAASLPLFLRAIPAGALADIVDRRKLLILGELAIMAAAIPLSILVAQHRVTPASLLLISFAVSSGTAIIRTGLAGCCHAARSAPGAARRHLNEFRRHQCQSRSWPCSERSSGPPAWNRGAVLDRRIQQCWG